MTTITLTSNLTAAILEVYSREVLYQAQPILRFEQFATKKEELGVMPGQTIRFLRYLSLQNSYPTDTSALTENVDMTTVGIEANQISITVGERGRAVALTEKLLQASFDDVMQSAAKLLGMHYAYDIDARIRDVLLTAPNVKYAGGKVGPSYMTTSDTFSTRLVKDGVEFLATNKAPKIGADAYICFVHPHQGRKLRDESAWINASNYGQPDLIFRGEIGRYEDVRFIETTAVTYVKSDGSIYADGKDTGLNDTDLNTNGDVYQAIMIGDHAVGHAVSLPVELRDNGVQDFGRKHSIAWYGIDGIGLIESGHTVILCSM